MSIKTTTKFIDSVRRRVVMPPTQRLLTNANLLEIASDIIESELTPILMAARQGYGEYQATVDIEKDVDRYDIPVRSVARGLKDVKWYSPDRTQVRDLVLLNPEYTNLYTEAGDHPLGFYFRGDEIVVLPTPTISYGFLEFTYHSILNSLCLETEAAKVASISGDTVTVVSTPTGFLPGVEVDFVKGRPGYSNLGIDAEVANIAGTQITFNTDVVPLKLQKGDYLSVAGTTPVIPTPDVCYKFLVTKTAMEVAEIIGDKDNAAELRDKYLKPIEADMKQALEPRITDEVRKIINPHGLLRSRFRRYSF